MPWLNESASFEYRTLFDVSESVALHRDLPSLFQDLFHRLPRVATFDTLWLVLHNPATDTMRLHIVAPQTPARIDSTDRTIEESASGQVWASQTPMIVQNTDEETRFFPQMNTLRGMKIKSYCILPLTTPHRRLGTMGFGSLGYGGYREEDLGLLELLARQVAVAVDNVLSHQENEVYQHELAHERDRLRLLLDLNNRVVTNLHLRQLAQVISSGVRKVMQQDYATVALPEPGGQQLRIYAQDLPGEGGEQPQDTLVSIDGNAAGQAFRTGQPVPIDGTDPGNFDPQVDPFLKLGLKSACCFPLLSNNRILGTLNVGGILEAAFSREDFDFLRHVASQVAIAIENALDYRQLNEARDQLAEEKLYLADEIRMTYNFDEIVGESLPLKNVLEQVRTVAPTESTVLVLGETGTGKELIARSIHNISSRRDRTFVKVNCAAIPLGLLESELFGHEKGAFTGAIASRIGRFELANLGTLFLDEIGDIPLELQPKLLRVLQEKEFERLGSTRTRHVDVRIIAATSQDLHEMIRNRTFRRDLYYRLNIFPITIPPLRERPGDICQLAQYFVDKHARQMNKRIDAIPRDVMEALTRYHWPGNVRELQNFLERAVILTPSGTLRAPLAEFQLLANPVASRDRTLAESERETILQSLEDSDWVLGGTGGAAERLGLKRTTLFYKMRRLGIERPKRRQRIDGASND